MTSSGNGEPRSAQAGSGLEAPTAKCPAIVAARVASPGSTTDGGRAAPSWLGWLGLVAAVFAGWLGLLSPLSDAIEGITVIGFLAFFVFMLATGIAILVRQRRATVS